MTRGKFFIMVNNHGEKSLRETQGYIKQVGSHWFGIHREENRKRKRWLWVVTELTTGLKVSESEYNTIREAEDTITEELVIMCENYFNGQYKELFKKDKEMVKEAYTNEAHAAMYWKLYEEEWS